MARRTLTLTRATLIAVAIPALAGCSLAPKYKIPDTPVAAQYRTLGPWVSAQPADRLRRDGWWTIYDDPRLDALEKQLVANNADLSAAWAHYQQSEAYVQEARSAFFPTISAYAQPQRDRQSENRPLRVGGPNDYTSATLAGQFNYEVDLWGQVRDSVAATRDEAQATQADLASAELSLEVQLADSYFRVNGLDREIRLLGETIDAYQRALQLTEALHSHGIVSGLDVSRAQTQLSSVQSELAQSRAQRALLEHAIAVLVGASASEFTLPVQTAAIQPPVIPAGVPSELLQRRPDVAAAERRVAEANKKIGVARTAYFPQLTLFAMGGVQSTQYANLLSAPNFLWTVGPQLVGTIFDGGLRHAQVQAARAKLDEAGADYRGVVLGAFQQVEDNLSLLADLGTALDQERAAADAAKHTLALSLQTYKQGAVSYLDVVQAQTAELDAERSVLDIETRRLSANVALIRALGGGWSSDELAKAAVRPQVAEAQIKGAW